MTKPRKPKPLNLAGNNMLKVYENSWRLVDVWFYLDDLEPEDGLKVARWFIEWTYWSYYKKHGKELGKDYTT